MGNTDWNERWGSAEERPGDTRKPHERDLARIVHSPAFRRLQGKTQVLGVGENDFYRTRLTHSVEVAQIAASIVRHHANHTEAPPELKGILPDASHITAISLFHDVGHPPFGHGGEIALNRLMHNHGGFEGNAQTLRICTKLGHTYNENGGLSLSKRTLLGLLKYPAPRNKVCDHAFIDKALKKQSSSVNGDLSYVDIDYDLWKPPKSYYDSEGDVVDWIFEDISPDEVDQFKQVIRPGREKGKPSHRKTKHKSIDASIMDLSDDISYGVHDLEDAIHLGLIGREDWNQIVDPLIGSIDKGERQQYGISGIEERLFNGKEKWKTKGAIGDLINYFINKSTYREEEFSDPILRFRIILEGPEREFLDGVQRLVIKRVIRSSSVQTLEFRGLQIVTRLFDALSRHPDRLLNEETKDLYSRAETEAAKRRVIADHVSGMTDDFATKLYERLFVPRRGSLFEKI